jgi:hypothetical protein
MCLGMICLILLVGTVSAQPQDSLNVSLHQTMYENQSYAFRVGVVDDIAYVASGAAGFRSYDISDPGNISPIAAFDSTGYPVRLAMNDSTAFYVCNGSTRIDKLRLPGDGTIEFAASIELDVEPYVYGVALYDSLLYVFSYDQLTTIHAHTLEELDSYSLPGLGYDGIVADSILYVDDPYMGVHTFSLENPASPQFLATIAFEDPLVSSLDVLGDLLFLAHSSAGFTLLDISDPSDPIELLQVTELSVESGYFVDNRLFVSAGDQGIQIYDLTDPATPVLMSETEVDGYPTGLVLQDDRVICCRGIKNIAVYDVVDPFTLSFAGGFSAWGRPYYLAQDGDRMVIVHSSHGISILDINDPSTPIELSRISDLTGHHPLLSGDTLVLIGYDNVVSIYSIANPESPQLLGQIQPDEEYFTRAVMEDDLLILHDLTFNRILGYDISDPSDPQMAGNQQVGVYSCYGMGLEDGILYYVAYDGVYVFDVSTGPIYVELGHFDFGTSSCYGGIYQAGTVYCAMRVANQTILYLIDVSDPANPQIVAADTISEEEFRIAGGMHTTNTTLSMSFYPNGLRLHDISTPFEAPLIGHWTGIGLSVDVCQVGDYLYVADDSRLAILDVSVAVPVLEREIRFEVPNNFEVSSAYPNPFNSTTTITVSLPSSGQMRAEVTDILGRSVNIVTDGYKPAGSYRLAWDGRTSGGVFAASGMYMLQVTWEDKSQTRRLILQK